MKGLFIFIGLLPAFLPAQTTAKTVICGTVSAESDSFEPFSYSGVMITEYQDGKESLFYSTSVDKSGNFSQRFAKHLTVKLYPYYHDYYETDTMIETGDLDTIRVDFHLARKNYYYSEAGARRDILAGHQLLVTSDSNVYANNERLHYTDPFHFQYVYLAEPVDYEFRNNRDRYNLAMQEHLDSVNGENWQQQLFVIEDSLEFLDADNYGRTHQIDMNALGFPKTTVLPQKMVAAIAEQEKEYQRLFTDKGKSIDHDESFVLDKIDNSKDYEYLFEAEFWIAFHYEKMIPELIQRIADKKYIGLTNTADLIIWERVESKDLSFYGEGGVVSDDLFTVAGRANYLLKAITGEDFGNVSMYSTQADLEKLQKRWAYWLMNLK